MAIADRAIVAPTIRSRVCRVPRQQQQEGQHAGGGGQVGALGESQEQAGSADRQRSDQDRDRIAAQAKPAAEEEGAQQQRSRHGQHLAEETDVEVGETREEQPPRLQDRERPEGRDGLGHVDEPAQGHGETQHCQDLHQLVPGGPEGEQQKPHGHGLENAVDQDEDARRDAR